ncbi:MAG TPA: hypothetical protein VG425_01490 [Casimicrobiaceae bacterium]|nr:hypothetical protein [Casimicrobiaceae bacterium]
MDLLRLAAPVGKDANWIQIGPGEGWFAYFRLYGPAGAVLRQDVRVREDRGGEVVGDRERAGARSLCPKGLT